MNLGQFCELTKDLPDDVELVVDDEGEEVVPTGTAQVGHYADFEFQPGRTTPPNAVAIWRA